MPSCDLQVGILTGKKSIYVSEYLAAVVLRVHYNYRRYVATN